MQVHNLQIIRLVLQALDHTGIQHLYQITSTLSSEKSEDALAKTLSVSNCTVSASREVNIVE